jgi:hypothetical protein
MEFQSRHQSIFRAYVKELERIWEEVAVANLNAIIIIIIIIVITWRELKETTESLNAAGAQSRPCKS